MGNSLGEFVDKREELLQENKTCPKCDRVLSWLTGWDTVEIDMTDSNSKFMVMFVFCRVCKSVFQLPKLQVDCEPIQNYGKVR